MGTKTAQHTKGLPTKYSLTWWFLTGKAIRAQGGSNSRMAAKFLSNVAYQLGYYIAVKEEGK